MQSTRLEFNLDIWAYVIMPDHVHLLIRPREPQYEMRLINASLKRSVSSKAIQRLIERNNMEWLKRLTVQKGNDTVFRFRQPGGGYDENIWNEQAILEIIDYIHNNPVRKGLANSPLEWRWSSAGFWVGEKNVPIEMDPLY